MSWTDTGTATPAFLKIEYYRLPYYTFLNTNIPLSFNGTTYTNVESAPNFCLPTYHSLIIPATGYLLGAPNVLQWSNAYDYEGFEPISGSDYVVVTPIY